MVTAHMQVLQPWGRGTKGFQEELRVESESA